MAQLWVLVTCIIYLKSFQYMTYTESSIFLSVASNGDNSTKCALNYKSKMHANLYMAEWVE